MDLVLNIFGFGFELHLSEPITLVIGLGIAAVVLYARRNRA